jgi:uncharacterized protein YbjT (DUF2867 family)
MILVSGATSANDNGVELVKLLDKAGQKVRVLARDPQKAASLKSANVEVVQGDLSDPASLDKALQGVEKVFCLVSNSPYMVELENNLIQAAKRAGVKHFVKYSVLGAKADAPMAFIARHWESEQNVEKSGIPYTHLRPNLFMQNMSTSYAQSIAQQGAFYVPAGDGKINMVDVRDVAAVAAAVLTESGHEGKTYEIVGPESITFHEVAERLSKQLGKPVNYVSPTGEEYKQTLLGYGVPEWLADDLVALDKAYSEGFGDVQNDTVKQVAKKDPYNFDQYAQDYAHRFKN